MKKAVAVIAVVAALAIGTAAWAAWGGGPGYGHMGYGPGYGMMGYGPGYGMMGYGPGYMMGYGPGYGMMGYGPGYGPESEKFLKETADIRRELNTKTFEYNEALRTGDEKKAEALAKDIEVLTGKLNAKAPEGRTFARGGYGYGCW
jgi:hypothetical protein